MARVVLWIEVIQKRGRGNYKSPPAGVDRVITDQRPFGYEPVRHDIVDYSHVNGVGSRGARLGFLLEPNTIYRVSSPQSWSRSDQYYCRVEGDSIRRMTAEEVLTWGKEV